MAQNHLQLLLVEDDSLEARLLKANLQRPGRVDVEVAGTGEEALGRLARGVFDAVLSDVAMPGMDGIELVRRVRAQDPALPIVLMTAHATLERAVEGIRAGATEFLQKPVNVGALLALVERAVAERPLREELTAALGRRGTASPEDYLVGDDARLEAVRRFARRVASVPGARVLVTGESGSGKSVLARAIHELSGVTGRFVEVNCAALPGSLLESELFGHEKGAFTDAKSLKRGLIELAHHGTLFLDEIGAMPVELQAKLLLFLESQEIRRVGGTEPIRVDVRVIAATNDDLRRRVRERTFRADLLYRLDVASIEMPPLREMPLVVLELTGHFLRELSEEMHRPTPPLLSESAEALARYGWPGNVRELRNAVERAVIFHDGGPIEVLPPAEPGQAAAVGAGVALELGLTLEEVERRYLEATLERHRGEDFEAIAQRLGIARKTLWEKRKRYGLGA
ncbi:MAG TPA: sigma-54 dependent transcriptional regulator [Longimicrobiales bacterium]|nr:sigma-54 dependent transcriptional regulator [Longimicrobiales bacterium]